MRFLEESILSLDEFEALRLADFEGLYQEDAAKKMGVSRPTFSRIVEMARKKVADALVNGKALKINRDQVKNISSEDEPATGSRGRWRGGLQK